MERISINQVETSEQFYQFPKILMIDDFYKKMSLEAKMLYTFMKDRMKLSKKNKYVDENGFVYIIYTNENAAEQLGCGISKAKQIRKELINFDLIEVVTSPGMKRSSRIYVGNLDINQSAETASLRNGQNLTYAETSSLHNGQNSTVAEVEIRPLERSESSRCKGQNLSPSKTELSQTDINKTEHNKAFDDDDDSNHLNKNARNTNDLESKELNQVINDIRTYMGITLSPVQKKQIIKLIREYSMLDISEGIQRSAENGGRSIKYLENAIRSVKAETDQAIAYLN